MSSSPFDSTAAAIVEAVGRLLPTFLENPIDREMCKGNAAVCIIDPSGRFCGRIFGDDKAKGRWYFSVAGRKVAQVWATGYATGRFEELVYARKLDETKFGLSRPDLIGWEGGVPLQLEDGSLMAAAFSGFRGINDVAIIERAVRTVPSVRVKRD